MRFTPATIALAALFATVSSVGISQRPDNQINERSLEWQAKGDVARSAGRLDEAIDDYESALAIDPRNRTAFIALGDVARAQGLPGKALRYYNDALSLEPTDMAALGGSVRALLERGAVANAKESLSRMKTLCRTNCGQIADLGALVDRTARAQAPAEANDVASAPDSKTIAQHP